MNELLSEEYPPEIPKVEDGHEEGVITIKRPNDDLLLESFKRIIRGPSEARRPLRQAHLIRTRNI